MSMLMLELEENNGEREMLEQMEAYLDNSATTRCSVTACQKVKWWKRLTEDFGNPSSLHMKGVEAERYVKEAATDHRKDTKRCQEKEIVFTSGGTESNNLAIIGAALANQQCRQTYYYYPV